MASALPKLDDHVIYIIHVPHREERAIKVQEILTKFGPSIMTRVGMHDAAHGSGIIMCAMMGDPAKYFDKFDAELKERGAEVHRTVVTH